MRSGGGINLSHPSNGFRRTLKIHRWLKTPNWLALKKNVESKFHLFNSSVMLGQVILATISYLIKDPISLSSVYDFSTSHNIASLTKLEEYHVSCPIPIPAFWMDANIQRDCFSHTWKIQSEVNVGLQLCIWKIIQ